MAELHWEVAHPARDPSSTHKPRPVSSLPFKCFFVCASKGILLRETTIKALERLPEKHSEPDSCLSGPEECRRTASMYSLRSQHGTL